MGKYTLLLILIFLLFGKSYSQEQFLDYIVKQNSDTIYGTFRNYTKNKLYFYEKIQNPKSSWIKFRKHNLKKVTSFKLNDKIYTYKEPKHTDGIYATSEKDTNTDQWLKSSIGNFIHKEEKLSDYVVTIQKDTIYGEIHNPLLGKLYLSGKNDRIVKINNDSIQAYRMNNEIFYYKEKERVNLFDNKGDYLKLLVDDRIQLFEYEKKNNHHNNPAGANIRTKKIYYFIQTDEELVLIDNFLYKKSLRRLFSENSELISKIEEDEYTLDNIYFIIKYYNEHL
ncbi:hypothetical protein [Salinimicrobium marinum]|nr:hypothetical protein [Salinimicrobium marinum]